MDTGLVAARRQAARGQAHSVRGRARRAARHRPRHLSLRHLLQYRGGAGGDRLRPRPPTPSTTCSASARPTRRALGSGRFRPTRWTIRSAKSWASAGANSAPSPAARAAAAGSTPCSVRQTVRICGIDGLALTKLDILDGFDEIKVCIGYRLDGREIDYLPGGELAQARVEPIYRDNSRLAGADRARALLGGLAGAGDQNTSAESRNWSAARWPCSPPARSARTRSWCKIHSRYDSLRRNG